jgi:hypothetical protein
MVGLGLLVLALWGLTSFSYNQTVAFGCVVGIVMILTAFNFLEIIKKKNYHHFKELLRYRRVLMILIIQLLLVMILQIFFLAEYPHFAGLSSFSLSLFYMGTAILRWQYLIEQNRRVDAARRENLKDLRKQIEVNLTDVELKQLLENWRSAAAENQPKFDNQLAGYEFFIKLDQYYDHLQLERTREENPRWIIWWGVISFLASFSIQLLAVVANSISSLADLKTLLNN